MYQYSLRKPFILFIALLTGLLSLSAQIKGKVLDEEDKPIEGAAVVALQLPDSTYINGTVTDIDGVFDIAIPNNIKEVVLNVEAIGYKKTTSGIKAGQAVTIRLPHSEIALSEVVVTPPKLSVSPGRFSFLPGDIVKDVTNALSVLEFVPLLRVDAIKDDISIIGKEGCTILVNGKVPIMSNMQLMKMLQASNPNRIKKVEVWLQPDISRQFEGAVINIILDPKKGLYGYGDFQAGLLDASAYSFRESGGVNIEHDRWQFSVDVSVHEDKSLTKNNAMYTNYANASGNEQSSTTMPANDFLWMKQTTDRSSKTSFSFVPSVGASLDLGHDNSIGLSFMSWFNKEKTEGSTTNTFLPSQETETTQSKTKAPFRPMWMVGRLNYDHTLDSLGSSLNASVNYTGVNTQSDNSYLPADAMRGYIARTISNSAEIKASWFKVLNSKASFFLGMEAFYDKVDNKLKRSADGQLAGPLTPEDDLCQQQVQADAYASFEYKFSDIFGMNAGVRGRWYRRMLDQHVQDVSKNHEDWYVMPTASISLSPSPMHMITLSYNSSVKQPYYFDTNPISYWLSPDYYYRGNPDLKAQISHELSLYYALIQKITLGGNVRFTNNISQRATLPQDNGVTFFMPLELGKRCRSQVFASYSDAFFSRRWRVYGKLTWTHDRLNNSSLPLSYAPSIMNQSRWDFNGSTSVTIGSDRSWELELSVNYTPAYHYTFINEKHLTNLTFDFSKQFKFGGLLQFSVYNLLDQKRSGWYDCEAYSQSYEFTNISRTFIIQFTYNFGKQFRMRSNPSSGGLMGR